MYTYNELISMGQNELQKELAKVAESLQELVIANRMRQLKETHKIRISRRYIAQVKTALANTFKIEKTPLKKNNL